MAAAHLRQAALKFVSDQRTQAVVRRRLLPMLFHTDQRAYKPPKFLWELLEEIDEKKEELYNLIAKTETGFIRRNNSLNGQLLKSLSTHVKPRPHDLQWRWLRGWNMFVTVMSSCIAFSGPLLGCTVILADRAARALDKQKREADAAKEKEEVLGPHPPAGAGADARTKELELLGEEINHLRVERQRLQEKLDAARSLAASGHGEEARKLTNELDVGLQAMLEANNLLREQVKAMGGKP